MVEKTHLFPSLYPIWRQGKLKNDEKIDFLQRFLPQFSYLTPYFLTFTGFRFRTTAYIMEFVLLFMGIFSMNKRTSMNKRIGIHWLCVFPFSLLINIFSSIHPFWI